MKRVQNVAPRRALFLVLGPVRALARLGTVARLTTPAADEVARLRKVGFLIAAVAYASSDPRPMRFNTGPFFYGSDRTGEAPRPEPRKNHPPNVLQNEFIPFVRNGVHVDSVHIGLSEDPPVTKEEHAVLWLLTGRDRRVAPLRCFFCRAFVAARPARTSRRDNLTQITTSPLLGSQARSPSTAVT